MSKEILGKYILGYRKKMKLTQQGLADILFVSNKTVSRWETGHGEPDLEQLARISELTGIPVGTLVGSAVADSGAVSGKYARSRYKRIAVSIGILMLLITVAAIIVSVTLCDSTLLPQEEPVITNRFEAEYAVLKAVDPQLSGNDSFVERAESASNGYCASYLGAKGNTVTFNINSSASDDYATLYIAVVSQYDDLAKRYIVSQFDMVWEIQVNKTVVKTDKYYSSQNHDNPYYDFMEVSVDIKLIAGRNVIELICPQTGDGMYGLNVDYIRIETDAVLSWYPYMENKIRDD